MTDNASVLYTLYSHDNRLLPTQLDLVRRHLAPSRIVVVQGPLGNNPMLSAGNAWVDEAAAAELGVGTIEVPDSVAGMMGLQRQRKAWELVRSAIGSQPEPFAWVLEGDVLPVRGMTPTDVTRGNDRAGRCTGSRCTWLCTRATASPDSQTTIWPAWFCTRQRWPDGVRIPAGYTDPTQWEWCEPGFLHVDRISNGLGNKVAMLEETLGQVLQPGPVVGSVPVTRPKKMPIAAKTKTYQRQVSHELIAARREACSECRKLRKTKHGQAYCRTHYDGCQRRAVGQYTNALLKQEPWCEPWLAMPLKPVMDGRGCLVCPSQIGVTGVGKQASASDENGDDQDKLDNAQTQVSHDSTPRVVTTESHATTPAKSTLFIAGHPHRLGGAGPHLWAVIRALRSVGVDVAILKKPDPKNFWYKRLMDLGVRYIPCKKPWLAPGIDGGIVGAWCSKTFCRHAHEFKARGCKVIWSGCMTFPLADERAHYAKHGFFDRHVVNSHFQHTLLRDALDKIAIPVPADKSHLPTGVKSGHSGHFITRAVHIPTPFWPDEFPFKPRPVEGEFVIGRLSRAADDKYQKDLWKCYGAIRDATPLPVRARVMAWSDKVEKWCGPPPEWAECLKANQESTIDFLHSLHCMVHKNGGAKENRPRVCMEAMATGCPVVAEACAGWPELIEHERTGFLCGSRNEFVEAVGRLASDEKLRQRIIHDARESLSTIANNAEIANAWKNMLEELQCQ